MVNMLILLAVAASPLEMKMYDVSYVDCYDGDTCSFNFHLGLDVVAIDQSVRFCDINTVEKNKSTKERAIEIRDAVHEMLVTAKRIRILVPQKTKCYLPSTGCDKRTFTRWLGYILVDGVNLNQKMLDLGLATEYTKTKCPLDLKPAPQQ